MNSATMDESGTNRDINLELADRLQDDYNGDISKIKDLDGSHINYDSQARLTDGEVDKQTIATISFNKGNNLPDISTKDKGTPRGRASMFNDLDNIRVSDSHLGGQSSNAGGSRIGKVNTGSKIMQDSKPRVMTK